MNLIFDIDSEWFRTTDILLAAILHQLHGLENLKKDVNNKYPDRYIFLFKNSPELLKTLHDWNLYNIKVEPRQFYAGVKQLKSMIALYPNNKNDN